jgi:hypothetical protein
VWPHHVTGDARDGATGTIVAVEDAGIRAYVPLPAEPRTKRFGRSAFTYEAAPDQYRCPAQHPLPRWGSQSRDDVIIYRADPALGHACPLKARCTTSDQGRMIHRAVSAAYLEKVRGYHQTAAYRKARRKRQVWVEPLCAAAKQWHGLSRPRLRGLMNATIQGLLIAAGQNLKRLLAARGRGRRHAPCGSLGARPAPPLGLVLDPARSRPGSAAGPPAPRRRAGHRLSTPRMAFFQHAGLMAHSP